MALIMGIQILGIFFALFILYYTFINFKRKQLSKGEFTFWGIIWLVFIFVSVFPTYLEKLAQSLSIYRTMDFLIIIGFFFLIGLTFYNFIQVKKQNRKLEQLVRKLSIERKKNR